MELPILHILIQREDVSHNQQWKALLVNPTPPDVGRVEMWGTTPENARKNLLLSVKAFTNLNTSFVGAL